LVQRNKSSVPAVPPSWQARETERLQADEAAGAALPQEVCYRCWPSLLFQWGPPGRIRAVHQPSLLGRPPACARNKSSHSPTPASTQTPALPCISPTHLTQPDLFPTTIEPCRSGRSASRRCTGRRPVCRQVGAASAAKPSCRSCDEEVLMGASQPTPVGCNGCRQPHAAVGAASMHMHVMHLHRHTVTMRVSACLPDLQYDFSLSSVVIRLMQLTAVSPCCGSVFSVHRLR